ncbi:MAG TPA: ABC transporter substrate-binding protein [Acetobacteraceae bacterium]|nr:ABC transporter substrate-binding protein [Acetobacteraceae bacterium]
MRTFTSQGVRRRTVLGSAIAGAFVGSMPAMAKGDILPLGLAMPMTGSQALFGTDQVRAAQWATDDINKSGGVNGKKLDLLIQDTQADPQIGINAFNHLAEIDKVPVVATAWSSVVQAIAPVADRTKTLALSIGASSTQIAHLGKYVYTTYPLASVDVTALAKYLYNTMHKSTAAVLYINNDSGLEGARVFRDVFSKLGGKIVAYEAYDPNATDFTGMLLKVRAANPEVVHIQGLTADIPQVFAQMRQLGMQMQVTSYSAGYNPRLIKQLGSAAEGFIVTSLAPGVSEDPNVGPFIERWQKVMGRKPNGLPYTQYLYDYPYIVKSIYAWLEHHKLPATGVNFRKGLLDIREFNLPMTGRLIINPDHTVLKPVYLMIVRHGTFVPLATIS